MRKTQFLKYLLACMLAAILLSLVSCTGKAYNNHTMHTLTTFGFTENGEARVSVSYTGYRGTEGANIRVKLERQTFLFFYEEVVLQNHEAVGESYQNEFFYPISAEGTYRCTVTYTVFGKGEDDVITFKDTKTYQASDFTNSTDGISSASSITETTSDETVTTENTTEETTTAESSATETTSPVIPSIPAISAEEFAEKLSLALAEKEVYNTEFRLQKTVTIDEKTYQTNIRTSIQSDFRSDILYSYFSTAYSQTEAFENYYIFIDDTLYISINGDRYQKPFSQREFSEKAPRHALSLLFGRRLHDAFSHAKITAEDDGSMTASLEIPFAIYYDPMLELIEFLTNDDFTEQTIHNYWNFVQVEVTLDENGALQNYSFAFSYDIIKDEAAIPTQYVIKATENEADLENFRKYLLPQENLDRYPTEKPEAPEQPEVPITPPKEPLSVEKEEFLSLFRDAYAKWNPERYKIKISSAKRTSLSGLLSLDTPLTQYIMMDCTDPNEPIYYQKAVSSESAYYAQTDIYFKNDRLYVSDYAKIHLTQQTEEQKYSVIMLSDYFLEDFQNDWLFFQEDMLTDAEIIKNEDGSVTAAMKVSGYGAELRRLIEATYGDDFSDDYKSDVLFYHNVSIAIDANGYMTKMTVSAQMQVTDMHNGSRYTIHYGFIIEPDYTDFNIDFPESLDTYEDITEEYYRDRP